MREKIIFLFSYVVVESGVCFAMKKEKFLIRNKKSEECCLLTVTFRYDYEEEKYELNGNMIACLIFSFIIFKVVDVSENQIYCKILTITKSFGYFHRSKPRYPI